jgi:hypothetical protein
MSAVLPVAEQTLSRERSLTPFGSTMSSAGQIVQLGGFGERTAPQDALSIAEFEASVRDGAARGEIRASALVIAAPDSVAVRLDHREDYSIVVTFPYRFSEAGELVIDEPFASEGEHRIFV